jgi:hypothetical protein
MLLSEERRKELEERDRCSEESLYLPLIASSFDVHFLYCCIMCKCQEKSSNKLASLTLLDETMPYVVKE